MITKAIDKALARKKAKNWDKTYWGFDIHETMIIPNWSTGEVPLEFYPNVKEVMQMITKQEDIICIIFTCSHPSEIVVYEKYFKEHDIHFDYINENPEVHSRAYGNYGKKPYFNVLFEDKAGFDPEEDWAKVKEVFLKHYPQATI